MNEVDEKGLAADERGLTQIENQKLIRVHRCSSAAEIGFFSILMSAGAVRQSARATASPPDVRAKRGLAT
jgi:hypothetical protein